MHGQWQPYPNHPEVRKLTELVASLQARIEAALLAGDIGSVGRLVGERRAVQTRLGEVAEALLRDQTLAPRWVEPSEAELARGALPCLACGNSIAARESACSYCGWKYSGEPAEDAEPAAAADGGCDAGS